jgi:hypothetical protein
MAKRQVRARETIMLAVPKAKKGAHSGPAEIINEGTLLNFDDPRVKGREHLFEETELVEQATAAPGEKRSVKKPAAKKPV